MIHGTFLRNSGCASYTTNFLENDFVTMLLEYRQSNQSGSATMRLRPAVFGWRRPMEEKSLWQPLARSPWSSPGSGLVNSSNGYVLERGSNRVFRNGGKG